MPSTSSAWPSKGALGDGASSCISWFYLDTHVCPLIAMGNSVWRKGFLAFKDCLVSPSRLLCTVKVCHCVGLMSWPPSSSVLGLFVHNL